VPPAPPRLVPAHASRPRITHRASRHRIRARPTDAARMRDQRSPVLISAWIETPWRHPRGDSGRR